MSRHGVVSMRQGPLLWLRRFARRYGWRAYALPVLTAITVLTLASGHDDKPSQQRVSRPTAEPSAVPTAAANRTLKDDRVGLSGNETVVRAAQLPAGPAYPKRGSGDFTLVAGSSPVVGTSGQVERYAVSVESGLDVPVDAAGFGRAAQAVLGQPTSWIAGRNVRLKRVDAGSYNWQIALTSALTVRRVCGYEIKVETSCWDAAGKRVVINASRWTRGAASYLGDRAMYRTYAINHEVGHAIGHGHAHYCLPDGKAPVMMQQTIGLIPADRGQACRANPEPYPPHTRGVPGREEPDTNENSEFGLSE